MADKKTSCKRKPYRRGKQRSEEDYDAIKRNGSGDFTIGKFVKHNDLSWYNRTPQVLKDACNISFNQPLGTTIDLGNGVTNPTIQSNTSGTVPGILTFDVIPGIGKCVTAQDAPNIASKAIYSFVRHANSGHANYDSSDLMLYILALDSAYYMYAWGVRAYKTYSMVSQRNRFLPEYLISAEGFDYNDFLANIANFRSYLNECAIRLKAFAVPRDIPLFARHAWLFSGVWSDSDDIGKAQFYMYRPAGYYTYKERIKSGTPTPGYLAWTDLGNQSVSFQFHSFAAYRTAMEAIIQPLVSSEDIGIMSGDILKAYGESNLYQLAMVTETDVLIPTRDELVLRQIQNSVVNYYGPSNATEMNVTQDITIGSPTEGCLIYNPSPQKWNSVSPAPAVQIRGINAMLNAGVVAPDPGFVAEITRTSSEFHYEVDSAGTGMEARFATLGTEFLVNATMWFVGRNTRTLVQKVINASHTGVSSASDLASWIEDIYAITAFDFHPALVCYDTRTSNNTQLLVLWDYENYTAISPETLEKINRACIFSEFGIPM